jgi:hypothetical protein
MEIGQNKPQRRDAKEINIESTQRWKPDEAVRDTLCDVTPNIQAGGSNKTEQTQFTREYLVTTKHMHQMRHHNTENLFSTGLLVTRSLVIPVQRC